MLINYEVEKSKKKGLTINFERGASCQQKGQTKVQITHQEQKENQAGAKNLATKVTDVRKYGTEISSHISEICLSETKQGIKKLNWCPQPNW